MFVIRSRTGFNITGVGVEDGVNSPPNLETLKLSSCLNPTDLKKILRISGSKLRHLDVSTIQYLDDRAGNQRRSNISPYAGETEPGRVYTDD